MFDTVIRNALVVDGTGSPPVRADIGIHDGLIRAIGVVNGPAQQIIDATGLTATPGFVDVHTHYDGQVTWDSQLSPSCYHGVTTVVMGNCGVGFAPVRIADRDWLIRLMEGVEDIPGSVLSAGIRWQWESFAEYLALLKTRSFSMDVAAQIPHGPLRTYVMGARGADHTVHPDNAEIAQMATLVASALHAGAIGFSTSRTVAHRSSDGKFTPSLSATPAELLAIAKAMAEVGAGIIEIVSDFNPLEEEFALIREIATVSGRPVSVAVTQSQEQPVAWRRVLDLIGEARAGGLNIHAQVTARPISVLMGLASRSHFLMASASYRSLLSLPLTEQIARLQQTEIKVQILGDLQLQHLPSPMLCNWRNIFRFADALSYLPDPEQSVANVAARLQVAPEAVAYDWLVEGGGSQFLFLPVRNYVEGNDRVLREMLQSEHTVIGLGDAGAHCGVLCDASMPTFLLTHWQERAGQSGFSFEWLIHQLTQRTAQAFGFNDRGSLQLGKRADINLIEVAGLRLQMPAYERDLPAGGGRLIQRAKGYAMTLVKGVVVANHGELTGALPGRLTGAW